MKTGLAGAALATTTALTWGGQFVVGKSALGRVDAFPLTTIRYALAALVLLALLVAVEGWRALRLDGQGWRLLWLGALGFAGFNLLAYTGLEHAKPQSAALVVGLGPLLTALVLWLRSRIRPSKATFGALAAALAGVALVISGGHPTTILTGSIGYGDALVLGGVLAFVIYTIGASQFPGLSPLRFTALTAGLGWLAIAAVTIVTTASGLTPLPSASGVWAVSPQILYLSLLGGSLAVVTWNASVGLIGPQNASLFGNLIPVTTFAIEIVRGYRPGAVELGGAALTITALLTHNLLQRRAARRPVVARRVESALAEAA